MSVVSKNPFDLLGDDGDESPAPKVAPKAAAPAAEAKPKRDVPGAKTPAGAASGAAGAGAGAGAQRGGRYPNRGGPRNVYKGDRTPPAADSVPEGTETGVFDGERAPPSRKSNHTRDAHTKGPRGSRPAKSYTSGGHTSSRSNIGGAKTPAQGGERRQFERRSGTIADSQKKVDQGWGANEGSAELTAEVEGQTDAITEEKAEAAGPDAVEADAAPVEEEPEEVQKSLDDYLAERASAALGILGKKEGRTVTADTLEGSKFAREGIAEFFSGKEKTAAAKSKAPKKEKVFIEFDGQFARPAGEREQRGERRGGDRDGSAPRGGARGGRGQGPRGGARGGAGAARGGQAGGAQRGPRSQAIDANDTSAFPALGA